MCECVSLTMQISDLFFVHHRGGMNGLYMIMVMVGVCLVPTENALSSPRLIPNLSQSFLTPMAAGYQATVSGWRASYLTMGIFCAILLVLFTFCYEETKYIPVLGGVHTPDTAASDSTHAKTAEASSDGPDVKRPAADATVFHDGDHHEIDSSIPMNPWRKRLALWTLSDESIWPYYYRPWMILAAFPHVMFTSLLYATGVMWLSLMSSVLSIVMSAPPYLFSPADIGYMSTGPFVGSILGALYGGFFGDRMILYFARRNKGYYEPEMRMYILFLPSLFICGGLIMFGAALSRVGTGKATGNWQQ